jgi:hypothetical protein
MFVGRILLFRLYESPRYLVNAGRHEEALQSLQLISRFNGDELPLGLADVDDSAPTSSAQESVPFLRSTERDARPSAEAAAKDADAEVVFDEEAEEDEYVRRDRMRAMGHGVRLASDTGLFHHTPEVKTYGSRDASPPNSARASGDLVASPTAVDSPALDSPAGPSPAPRPRLARSATGRRSSFHEVERRVCLALPHVVRKPLWAWLERMELVLAPEWRRTTVLVWCAWFGMSLGERFCVRVERKWR